MIIRIRIFHRFFSAAAERDKRLLSSSAEDEQIKVKRSIFLFLQAGDQAKEMWEKRT